jgi:hypothetical protein
MQENKNVNRSRYSFTSFCLGVAAILPIFGILFSLLSIIFGFFGLKEIKRENKTGKGLAVAGLILATLFLILNVGGLYLIINKGNAIQEEFKKTPKFQEVSKQAGNSAITGMIGLVEKYKIDNGKYPDTIYDLQPQEKKDKDVDNYFRYKKNPDGNGYEVEFVGLDEIWGTTDDVRVSK